MREIKLTPLQQAQVVPASVISLPAVKIQGRLTP